MPMKVSERIDRLPNTQAKAHFDKKGLLPAFSYLDVKAEHHAIAFTVAKMMDEDMLADIKKAMQESIDNGTSFYEFKRRAKPYLMQKGWWGEQIMTDPKDGQSKTVQLGSTRRLKTIYHTNKSAAYAAGRWQRLQRTKALLPYLEYRPSTAKNKRDTHTAYYGLIRHIDDPIWQHIFPPNGFGCRCWVKALSEKEAKDKGITPDGDIPPMVDYTNPRTGETYAVMQGIHPSFSHNHDRLSALLRVAEDKHSKSFLAQIKAMLDDFMVDLIFQPDFVKGLPTVLDGGFEKRFNELHKKVKEKDGNRKNSMELRKELARGDVWAVATLSTKTQQELGTTTAIIWLSDDTMVKMMAHHPELTLLELFKDTAYILKNAVKIVKTDELNVVYFSVQGVNYIATVKATKDKSELYLTTIYEARDKDFYKMLEKSE